MFTTNFCKILSGSICLRWGWVIMDWFVLYGSIWFVWLLLGLYDEKIIISSSLGDESVIFQLSELEKSWSEWSLYWELNRLEGWVIITTENWHGRIFYIFPVVIIGTLVCHKLSSSITIMAGEKNPGSTCNSFRNST